ncbi:E3.2.1.4 [Mytilus coruscus]|uniref:Endoglucanase n=1 Tax=Mytilus coruscus TaxID=42192 RepID=A0A6J8ECJ2_MYTCO|nr:E3.2.1.4 [Mytilus coruscus]
MAVVTCLALKRRPILNALNFDTKFGEMGKSGRTIIRTSNTNMIVLCVHYYTYMTHTSELWVQMGNISSVKDGRRFSPIHQLCVCLSQTICKLLPAVHALTGCDTTSSLFGEDVLFRYKNQLFFSQGDDTKYNYDEVLEKSILFYAAQRSGKLPADNPIPWRNDSAVLDKGQNGEDLTGRWYDAGDNVKFGFPMSATVGDGGKDHAFWGRPEDMKMDRPAFKITATNPGSDVAAEYAAAMAVGSMVFKEKDPAFSSKLLTHATHLYEFAKTYNSVYSTSVPEAAAYCRSVMYEDELSWGGAWLYMATNDSQYLDDAEKNYQTGAAWGQLWDDKNTGNMILLYNITKKDIYKQDLEQTFKNWMPGANMAFMALLTAEVGMHPTEYRKWAKSQIGYALGRKKFCSSSCPMMPGPCSDLNKQADAPNPHTLFGALVGGPGQNDQYKDDRNNYINNEVACDYNAGFQSAVAGLKSLHLRHILDR